MFDHENEDFFKSCGVEQEDVVKEYDGLPVMLEPKSKAVELILNADTPEKAAAFFLAYLHKK